jgi:hypothetical protein
MLTALFSIIIKSTIHQAIFSYKFPIF